MENVYRSRTRIIGPLKAALFGLVLPLFLAACNAGAGGYAATSPTTGGSGTSSGGGSGTSSGGGSGTATSNSAALTWNPVSAANLSGYRVYYGTTSGVYSQAYGQGISAGNATTYTVLGLSSGTRYYFVVTAYDTSNNESGSSNESYKDIP